MLPVRGGVRIKNRSVTGRDHIFFFLLSMGFFIVSCSGRDLCIDFKQIEKGRWYLDSTLIFTMDSLDAFPKKRYDVTVELASNRRYPYRNLVVAVKHNFGDTLFRADTLHILLADELGRWLGSGVGGLNQLSVPFLDGVSIDSARSYEVRICHNMKADPLRGIEKIGIRITESSKTGRF